MAKKKSNTSAGLQFCLVFYKTSRLTTDLATAAHAAVVAAKNVIVILHDYKQVSNFAPFIY